MMKKKLLLTILLLFALSLANVNIIRVSASDSQDIGVSPASTVDTGKTPGQDYDISIYTDYYNETASVWGYDFTLTYNPCVLNATEVTNGDLIVDGTVTFELTINNTLGKLSACAFFYFTAEPAPLTSSDGSETLANVKFKVVGIGESNIALGDDTKLMGYTEGGYGDEYNIIDYRTPDYGHILHGYFKNTNDPLTHDLAVTSVTPSPIWVYEGRIINVAFVVKNWGNVNETFTVNVYYNDTQIEHGMHLMETKIGVINNGTTTPTLNIDCNTKFAGWKNYTIVVEVEVVPFETNTGNNVLAYTTAEVHFRIPGDIDGNRAVDSNDPIAFFAKYGTTFDGCDLDGDGHVGSGDFAIIAGNYFFTE